MTPDIAKQILDKIIGQVFGYQNPLSLDQFAQKYAFDIRLPSQVNDSTTGEVTWASSTNPTKFLTLLNARKRADIDDFMLAPRPLQNIQDILQAWNETNYTSTERYLEALNVSESDCIYNSENVYRSQDINFCKNVLFSDGANKCEFIAALQRSNTSTFCIRVDDSQHINNSFSVSWSNKVSNSFFINDCFDVMECMFCSHVAGKQFCIANMQFEEAEYRTLKDMVIRWVLTG
jgi:hypothetical protein